MAMASGSGRTAAPTLGLVLAGVALAASVLPWTGGLLAGGVGSAAALVAAAVAAVAFAARRHGRLARPAGAPLAGLASLGVAGVALWRLVAPALGTGGTAPAVTAALPAAALGGLAAAGVAFADWRGVPDGALWAKTRGFGGALLVGFLAFLLSTVVASLPAVVVRPLGTTPVVVVVTIGSGVGLALFTAAYVAYRDLGLEYVDVEVPDLWDVAYGFGGVVALFGLAVAVNLVFVELGLPTATSSIEDLARDLENPEFLLALVPLSWLVIGPGEELVYRNLVQKRLYESFSEAGAVVVASVVFAVVHFQQYADPNPVAMLSVLSVVFALSVILGYTYARTENLLVPAFIHGTFNAVQFFGLYWELAGGVPA